MQKRFFALLLSFAFGLSFSWGAWAGIDRKSVVSRNCPHVTVLDSLASLSVGNGGFAFTADVTGLQSCPEAYSRGVPLGTQSHWGWHSFPNPENYVPEDALRDGYSSQFFGDSRQARAADWLRANPHRLHLGYIGFEGLTPGRIKDIDQTLDLWRGELSSNFSYEGVPYSVRTVCAPDEDRVVATVRNPALRPVTLRFPYPTGAHTDDASDWSAPGRHETSILSCDSGCAILERKLDETIYYVKVCWENASTPEMVAPHTVILRPTAASWAFSVSFSQERPSPTPDRISATSKVAARHWKRFWTKGGFIDFGRCRDPRARELERRVILSQYLTAIQCTAATPPQETGLTYNSWFGKFHLEMIWWHQAHFALWGREALLSRTLTWYETVAGTARDIARRQGYDGLRWMKMTDPSGQEAPSNIGSFLLWQQPHLIYLAELLYRAHPDPGILLQYGSLVDQTATFLASFIKYDAENDRYYLDGLIPAQETLRPETTVNPPFELAYCRWALGIAQDWRQRTGKERNVRWDDIIRKISPLAEKDGLYLAAESSPDTYRNPRLTSDHMAVLAAFGFLPESPLFDAGVMKNTLEWVCANWNWDQTWGWDFPVTAMNATRLGEPQTAVDALLKDCRTNTYLPNGHNYQNEQLRCYLPGNGGLLATMALMCAGWDGCTVSNPGFPKDGLWDVRWEGLKPLP